MLAVFMLWNLTFNSFTATPSTPPHTPPHHPKISWLKSHTHVCSLKIVQAYSKSAFGTVHFSANPSTLIVREKNWWVNKLVFYAQSTSVVISGQWKNWWVSKLVFYAQSTSVVISGVLRPVNQCGFIGCFTPSQPVWLYQGKEKTGE